MPPTTVVGVLRTRSSLITVTEVVKAADGRLGFNADGVLLDANGLVIANTVNEGWLLRPTVSLAPAVEALLLAGSVWGTERHHAARAGRHGARASDRRQTADRVRLDAEGRRLSRAGDAADPDRLDLRRVAAVRDLSRPRPVTSCVLRSSRPWSGLAWPLRPAR